MKLFGLTETKLLHFHRIFNLWGGGGGGKRTPLDPPLISYALAEGCYETLWTHRLVWVFASSIIYGDEFQISRWGLIFAQHISSSESMIKHPILFHSKYITKLEMEMINKVQI